MSGGISRVSRNDPFTYPEWSHDDVKPVRKQAPGWDGKDVLTTTPKQFELPAPHILNLKGSNTQSDNIARVHAELLSYKHLVDNLVEATSDDDQLHFGQLDERSRETLLEMFLLNCRKTQIYNNEENGIIINESIEEDQKELKELKKLYFSALDEQIKLHEKNEKLSKASTIVNALMISGAIFTLAFTVISGNIPAALSIFNGAGAVASGALSIAEAELQKSIGELKSTLLEISNNREVRSQKMNKEKMKELKNILDNVLNNYTQHRTVQENRLAATKWR